jgi:hypothetical protein
MLVQSRVSSFSRICAVVIKDRSQPVFVTGSLIATSGSSVEDGLVDSDAS